MNPYEAPTTQPRVARLRLGPIAIQVMLAGVFVVVLDLLGMTVDQEFAVVALIARVALVVGGLTAMVIGVLYLLVPGRRLDGVGLGLLGFSYAALGLLLVGFLFVLYP